jgi:arabinofuranan 3-O-arabinosyltransferase
MTTTVAEPVARPLKGTLGFRTTGPLRAAGYAILALLAYIPLLRTAPGKVVADTKTYLYLDPGRLLERASSMWDPNIGFGTVTHQNIGYLFPMGPYYWVMHSLGVPSWVSQRLWLGSILFLAGVGMLYLMRTLRLYGPGAVCAALVFMFTPYLLDFASRLSVILLPWAGLPWMLALVIRALRDDRSWSYAAAFAIVVQIVGSVNATALVFAGIAPVLWILYAVVIARDVSWSRAFKVTAKIGGLTLFASLWWIAGLSTQSRYGLNVLKFSETVQTVSLASSASEVLRGLGYWFFYGIDKLGTWTEASMSYTQNWWLIAVSFAIPVLALVAAAVTRWRHRVFFVFMVLVGVAVGVGAFPYDEPSVLGRTFKDFAQSSNLGLALRSTSRAVPLVVLGLAVLIGVGVNAVSDALSTRLIRTRGLRARGLAVAGIVAVLALVDIWPLWRGTVYGANLLRDENIPTYYKQAAAALDRKPHDTRVLEIPGADFAAYRWGQTVDPVTPGLMDRPYVARELIPWGSPPSANLLKAFDRRMQEGVLDPAAIAPIARLMSAGDILYRADLETDRFDLVRARPLWLLLTQPIPAGLGTPQRYGTDLGRPLHFKQLDPLALSLPANAPDPPPVSVFPVQNPETIVRAKAGVTPLVVSGDGDGVVDLAAIGGLGGDVVLYSGSFAQDPAALKAQIDRPGAVLIVTDSNRKRGQRWSSVKWTEGATERADETLLARDEKDNRPELFPGAGTDAFTVVQTPGVKVSTTSYGNPDTYEPEMRANHALDGNTSTMWLTGERKGVIGEKLRIDLHTPIRTDHVNLVQPLVGNTARYMTKVRITFDGKHPTTATLGAASRTAEGETVKFPTRSFHRIELTVLDTNVGNSAAFPFVNGVGFAEVRLRDDRPGAQDVRADEIVRMPTDVVGAAGATAAAHPLVFSMNRSRTVVVRLPDETALVRSFTVPDTRTFTVRGTVRLDPVVPDPLVDTLLGIPDASAGGITVTSSQRLPGSVAARGSAAFDGDPTTAWTTGFEKTVGAQWVDVKTGKPVTFDHLDLQIVADGRHSVPTKMRIDAGGASRDITIPPVQDQSRENAVVPVRVNFAPLTGDDVRLTITDTRRVITTEYYENQPIEQPVAIAEVGMPGVRRAPMPQQMPAQCHTDLLTLDGSRVGVRIGGTTADATALRPLDLSVCDSPSAASVVSPAVTLTAAPHVVRSMPGTATGVDVDGLVVASSSTGGAMALGPRGALPAGFGAEAPAALRETPKVQVTKNGRTDLRVHVSGATRGTPFWLVLGESANAGWKASIPGTGTKGSTLADGYANGWLVNPRAASFDVALHWTPQRRVWASLLISAVVLALCLGLVIGGAVAARRRARTAGALAVDGAVVGEPDATPVLVNPFGTAGPGSRTAVVAGAALVTALLGLVVARWWIGAIAGVLVALVGLRPRLRPLLTVGAPLALGFVALYMMVDQHRHHWVSDLTWPSRYTGVSQLAWLAVVLLAGDAIIEIVRNRTRRRDD